MTQFFTSYKIRCKSLRKKKVTQLNESAIDRSPVIHGQINLIRFAELNKFDNVYSKI